MFELIVEKQGKVSYIIWGRGRIEVAVMSDVLGVARVEERGCGWIQGEEEDGGGCSW